MQEPIRVGVAGFGLAGRIFHTAVIAATPGLELASIVQRSGDDASRHYPGVRQARSLDELLADSGISLVVIATPSYSHYELARQCLHAQRHVVIDKPFTLASSEAADLIRLARERSLLLTAYQNRRWDGDFQAVRQILASGELGRLVSYESHIDRFRADPRLGAWREDGGPGGGILFDLGPHLVDQALTLFGVPSALTASIRIERDGARVDDAWDLFLEYSGTHPFTVLLRATLTAFIPGPRFVLHGTRGSFVKYGIDPQEDQLKSGLGFDAPGFGHEPENAWGELRLAPESTQTAAPVSRRIPTPPGDYRGFYANVRDALLGRAPLAVTPEEAWRTTRLLELARESSSQGRRLHVDLSHQP